VVTQLGVPIRECTDVGYLFTGFKAQGSTGRLDLVLDHLLSM
jgi:hypothetical protein